MSFLRILKSVECPVEGCPARENTLGRLRENFMCQHWKLKVAIMQEGPEHLLWCDQYGIHMPAATLFNHRHTDKCNKATNRRLRRRDVEMAETCGETEFSLEGEAGDERVDDVETFRYLPSPLD